MRLLRLEYAFGLVIGGSAVLTAPAAADRPYGKTPPHTRSIVACDPARGQCGIAVVSFPSGVSAVVPVAEPGVMVANQFWPNLATARRVIDSVKSGKDPETALNEALVDDPDPTWRQLGVAALDATSASGVSVANWTGSAGPLYLPEVCSQKGSTYAVQAGLQTSTEVCAVMAAAFERTPGLLARRLLAALKAGAAIGDVRGEYSATVRVISDTWDFAWMTPWVVAADVVRSGDWQADAELAVDEWLAEWWTPGDTADLVTVTREKARKIQKILRALGYYRGPAHGSWTTETEDALKAWEVVQLGWEKPTVVDERTRYIEEAVAGYLILGWPRGVLVPNPAAESR